MNDVNNPFLIYAYAGSKYFCDRVEETERLISALRNGRNVTLMSPRRMGKTRLIQNVFHRIRQDYPEAVCFYMDTFSTTCLDNFIIQFGQTVIGRLDNLSQKTLVVISGLFKSCRLVFSPDVLTGVPQAILDFQPSQAQTTLKEIFDYLEHSGKECYIAIDEFQRLYGILTENQSVLLRAIAREQLVTAINSSAFIKKYGLKGSSSINVALKFLINKEYVFKAEEGYCVYDRFMELWLQTLPYAGILK